MSMPGKKQTPCNAISTTINYRINGTPLEGEKRKLNQIQYRSWFLSLVLGLQSTLNLLGFQKNYEQIALTAIQKHKG
jgi:hypothetical protein